MKYKEFIEEYFVVDEAQTGRLIPFKFNKVQNKYYNELIKTYGLESHFMGARELILKARREGFTSLILALFMSYLILTKDPARFLEISYKEDATHQHFRRAKRFIISYFQKKSNLQDEQQLEKIIFRSIKEGSEFVLAHNNASFYVGTASTRTGERGGSVQGVLFSEVAHYPNTAVLSASEIVEGTRNMVSVDSGMIFLETTASPMVYFKDLWGKAKRGEVDYKPRFFSWREFYTPEQFEKIKAGFGDKRLVAQEYPENDTEAFLTGGDNYFDVETLKWYLENAKNPIKEDLIYV